MRTTWDSADRAAPVSATGASAHDGAPVAVARGVTHWHGGDRGRDPVLRDVDLAVAPGELLVLAGRSGSGKSTLCHLLAGISAPSSGDVLVDGDPAVQVRDWRRVTVLPQRLGLVEELSVAENVGWPCRLAGVPVPGELLGALALDAVAVRPVHQTSLGEQQRTGLARALATCPRVAVLDEPTGHQDDANVDRVLEALASAARGGTALVVATHDERVIDVADRVVRLRDGRVQA